MGVIIDEIVGEVAPAESESVRGGEGQGSGGGVGGDAEDKEQRARNIRREFVRLAAREARLRAN